MRPPELLAPAGNLEKLETALHYGADAVYCGLTQFSLRAQAGNLDLDELRQGCTLAHDRGKKLYLTLNAYLRPSEEESCRALLISLREFEHDAYILADPGMLSLIRSIDPHRDIHLSTQANTLNAAAANFWQSQQVKRLNLARELSLEEIRTIRTQTTIELEMFVHGAMCMAYSGRCLLSTALTNRSANQGNCSHPCRWEYHLQEATRPGELFPIEEDRRGTYLFNSRDLCLIEHLPELFQAGVDSLKIEGRMKSRYYVAAVTRVYRAAVDAYLENPEGFQVDPQWLKELDAVSHRPYGTGFLFADDSAFVHAEDSSYRRQCDFVGVVLQAPATGPALVEGRNRFQCGDRLELIGPGMNQKEVVVESVTSEQGKPLSVVQPNARVLFPLPQGTREGDLLRRWK
ncbi:MAG: peptidase U32 [Desulfuromonas sp.]|nr:MAG: peptidase U32 [Desulfuromonas sp.]